MIQKHQGSTEQQKETIRLIKADAMEPHKWLMLSNYLLRRGPLVDPCLDLASHPKIVSKSDLLALADIAKTQS